MRILDLGSYNMIGFPDFTAYKPYFERAKAARKHVFAGKAVRVQAMQAGHWVSREYMMVVPGNQNYYNYKEGVGKSLATAQESFQSAIDALNNPEYIIIWKK